MLTSLFGALHPRRPPAATEAEQDFAVTAMLESPAGVLDPRGAGKPLPARDLFIRCTSADAICQPLLKSVPDTGSLGRAVRRITLFDPGRTAASGVVRVLSDASGEARERVYLRRHDTLATLALVERTALPRRTAEPLQISQVEVRSAALRAASVPLALLGRSHMAVVTIAPMAAPLIDELLTLLYDAVQRPDWRCPNLLLIPVAPTADTSARLAAIHWPAHLNVETCVEAPASASAVWNAVLRGWNRLKLLPQRLSPAAAALSAAPSVSRASAAGGTVRTRSAANAPALGPVSPVQAIARPRLDRLALLQALETLAGVRGVRAAALVDSTTGLVLGRRLSAHAGNPDLDQAALTLSEVLKAHRRATLDGSREERIEEVLVTQPLSHQVLRTLTVQPHLFLFVLLDRADSNLALARLAVAKAEKNLA